MRDHGYGTAGWRLVIVLELRATVGVLRYFLDVVVPLLYLVGILSVAGAAAASITSEHEDDTWVSLTATDLTGREIVLAKLLGSLWRARRLAAVIGLLLVAGVVVGSLHYLSPAGDRPGAGRLRLVRRGAGGLDLDPAPLDLAGPVPDDRRCSCWSTSPARASSICSRRAGSRRGLAGVHAL